MLDSKINKTVYEITPGSIPLGSGYQISFTFFSNDQIRVYLTNGLTQVEVDSSNYSIIKDETIYKVAFLSDYVFPSDAIRLVIAREVAFQQNTNLINGELIDAEVLERALDLLAAMSQQLKEITDRVVLSPISENTQTIIPEKSDRAGRILGFDEKGDPTSILTSDIDQKLKQSLSAQEQVISLSSIIEGYRDQAYQSATNAQTSEENVLVKEEQVSGTLVQIQNIKQQIDDIKSAVELSETNAAESSSSAAESANTAKNLLDQADLNLIESIEQTLTSTESAGENQVTITQKNGNQSVFSIFNGKQGPAVPLVQTTGTSTTSAMSQKAVTEALKTKSPESHSHVKQDITDFDHNHDDRYYTENEIDTKVNQLKSDLVNSMYPIGSIYLTVETSATGSSSPAQWIGGTWEKLPENLALWTASSGAGETISAGLPNITGRFTVNHTNKSSTKISDFGGAFTQWGKGPIYTSSENETINDSYGCIFNANNGATIQGIYRDDCTTVQPPAYKVYAWKRIA